VLVALTFSVKGKKKIDVVGFKILDSGMVGESVYLQGRRQGGGQGPGPLSSPNLHYNFKF